MIAGVLTANELALLRTRPQRTQLYLAIPDYHTIYTARTNGAPATNDNIISVAFDGGIGTLTNVKIGMTLFVGSSTGAWDIGIARIRDDSLDLGGGTGTFFIGITSEIDWADDLYLTVIDDYGLWPKHPYVSATAVYMDYGIAYTNQNVYGDPVPIMGTHAVVELVGGTATVHFDASDSYNCIGTPDHYDYEWYVDNVFLAATATVDIAFASVGTYTIRLEVTADYAIGSPVIEKTSVAVRYVIVHDRANSLNASFALDGCEGDFDSGGWSYRVTMNAKASEAYVRDRTLCLLVARDWYGDTEQSIGPLDGRENIICVGWVDGESLRRSNDKSMVSFEVQGPAFWLGVQEGFPTGIDDTLAAPTDWSHIQALDPRKGLFSFLHWRTTSTAVMDCWITADNHRLATTYTPAGTLLEQLRAIAEKVNAKTVCDRYGRLFCEIDTQFIVPASRTFPVVQTLSDRDWRDEITIERRTVSAAGKIDLSGVHWGGTVPASSSIFSLSPGHISKHHGNALVKDRFALDDQAEANTLAGLWLGYLNNEYPNIDTPMSSNYRAVDIAPRMFVQMNLAAGDTPRGIIWTNKKLIPRRVSFGYDAREALLLTDVTFEAEAFPSDAIVGDPPIEPPDPPITITIPPPTLCNDPTAENFGGLAPCIYPDLSGIVVAITANYIGRSLDFFTASPATNVTWDDISTGLPVGCQMYNLQIGGLEGWLLVIDAGSYDLYYCSDLTAAAPAWSLVITDATARTYPGVWAGHSNRSIASTSAGVCYLAAKMDPVTTDVYYWRCVAGAVAGFDHVAMAPFNGTCQGDSQSNAACDDGVDVYLSCDFGTVWISPTLNTGASVFGVAEFFAISSAHGNDGANILTLAGAPAYLGGMHQAQMTEAGGNTFWIRNADGFLMINAAVQAVPNDTDGGTGTFSVGPAAAGSRFYAFGSGGYTEILWTARTAAASNSKRSIAYTSDGGVTWETRDGNWAAVFGAWEGGLNSMIRASFI